MWEKFPTEYKDLLKLYDVAYPENGRLSDKINFFRFATAEEAAIFAKVVEKYLNNGKQPDAFYDNTFKNSCQPEKHPISYKLMNSTRAALPGGAGAMPPGQAARHYPLTAPMVRPETKYFWKKG